ncbi:MAG: hypothetical protein ACLTW7_15785 [Enterococcus sp.]|uniref:hypothetical protein n=1 Tax=Enterococcus sp. TaxID=35783 RepID=UPI00399175D2
MDGSHLKGSKIFAKKSPWMPKWFVRPTRLLQFFSPNRQKGRYKTIDFTGTDLSKSQRRNYTPFENIADCSFQRSNLPVDIPATAQHHGDLSLEILGLRLKR